MLQQLINKPKAVSFVRTLSYSTDKVQNTESSRNQEERHNSPLLKNYGAHLFIPIQWGEMDLFRHVNNVTYARYIESARIKTIYSFAQTSAALREKDITRKLMKSMMSASGVGVILKSLSINYKRPLTFPDTIVCGSSVSNISSDRFNMTTKIISKSLNDVCCIGDSVIVCYDYSKGEKCPFPPLMVEILKEWNCLYTGEN